MPLKKYVVNAGGSAGSRAPDHLIKSQLQWVNRERLQQTRITISVSSELFTIASYPIIWPVFVS